MPTLLMLFPEVEQQEDQVAPEAAADAVRELLGTAASCEDSRTWLAAQANRSGDLESTAWDTVLGRQYGTKDVNFQGFVVCVQPLDDLGAHIVRLALKNNRVVLALDEASSTLLAVIGLYAPGPQGPWTVKTTAIGA